MAAAFLALLPQGADGQSGPAVRASESDVKAALVLKFAETVEWPAGSRVRSAPTLNICTIGEKVLGDSLGKVVDGKTIHDRRVVAKHVTRSDEVVECSVLFVSARGQALKASLSRFARLPILTVGDADGFLAAGGMIGFFRDGSRIGFEVNQAAAEAVGLVLDRQLVAAGRTAPAARGD